LRNRNWKRLPPDLPPNYVAQASIGWHGRALEPRRDATICQADEHA
jgi:hypothetical protein